MGATFGRAVMFVIIAGALAGLIVLGALATGVVRVGTQPASMAQPCVQTSNLVPSLVGDDSTTQIRLSSPDLKSQRVLRTEPATHLPAMFESLLAVSPDSSRLAYVTADDEQMSNARLTFVDVAHPETPHVIASEAFGMLPIRPVWSPSSDQLAFVVARTIQGTMTYNVLAASATGGPVLNIASLPPDSFRSLETNILCVTPAGSVDVLPPPASRNNDVAGAATSTSSPTAPSAVTTAPPSGGTRCSLPVLSQNDPRWKDHRMQPTGESLGAVGCAVTSTAMVLDYYSSNLTPDQLTDCLGTSAVPIFWSQAIACTGGRVNGAVASEFSWAKLDAILAAGRPAIVGMLGGPIGMHFVVVTRGGGDVADAYRIVDPWNGRSDSTLGAYTRHNWTLFQLVDFRSAGPGCGKLLTNNANNALKVVDGVTDGAMYQGPVTIRRLVDGVPVTVRKLAHGNQADQKWDLGSLLTLTDNGNYQVVIHNLAGGMPTVLSFTIDHSPPSVSVKFLNQVATPKVAAAPASQVVLGYPGQFAVIASDPFAGIISIDARLDGTDLVERSVAGLSNRTLIGVVTKTGPHQLVYSATSSAGLSAGGQVSFTVQSGPVVGPPIVVPGLIAVPRPPGAPTVPIQPILPIQTIGPPQTNHPVTVLPPIVAVPPAVVLLCVNLTSVGLADSVTRTPVGSYVHALAWQGNGTCGPFSGTITATYRGSTCTLFCTPTIRSSTYTVTGASGSYLDQTSGNISVSYTLTLRDARGNTATGSAS